MAAPSYFIATYSSRSDLLLRARQLIAPLAHPVEPGGLVFEVDSRYRRETLDRISALSLPDLRIGGAFTRTASIFAALISPGTILPYRRERGFLASFPLEHLALQAELPTGFLDTMFSWGVRTFGELVDIPPESLAARLGQGALLLQRMAVGEDAGLPGRLSELPVFREKRDFDWPVGSTEALMFPLAEMMESICRRVSGTGRAVRGINLLFTEDDGGKIRKQVETALPSCNSRLLLSLLRLELDSLSLQGGVKSVEMEASPAKARVVQHSLLEPETLEPEEKGLTLSLVEKSWPDSSVGIPAVLDTHEPDPGAAGDWRESGLLKGKIRNLNLSGGKADGRFPDSSDTLLLTLRRERPPRPVKLSGEDIVSLAGPWRSSGGWWKSEEKDGGWGLEEWDMELRGGELYRVSWNPGNERWYLEGVYD